MRGGKRARAGRKSLLSYEDRLTIGADVHNRLAAAAERKKDAKLDQRLDPDLKSSWTLLHSLPLKSRRSATAERLLYDVKAELAGRDNTRVPHRRVYGGREEIIREVALERSKELGKRITVRTAEKCLEEYRSITKKLRADRYRPKKTGQARRP